MANQGTIIGQIQTTAPTHHAAPAPAATPPASIPQVTAAPTPIQHLQAAQTQHINVSQAQHITLSPTTISPPKEMVTEPSISVAENQSVSVAMDVQKDASTDGKCRRKV